MVAGRDMQRRKYLTFFNEKQKKKKENKYYDPELYSAKRNHVNTADGGEKCARIKMVGSRRNDGQTGRGHTKMYGHRHKSIYRDFASRFACLLRMSLPVNLSLA